MDKTAVREYLEAVAQCSGATEETPDEILLRMALGDAAIEEKRAATGTQVTSQQETGAIPAECIVLGPVRQ